MGQIRYDRIDAETAQISFSVAPRFRGKGMGTRLLDSTVGLAGRELRVQHVQGIAFIDNVASRQAFLKARFRAIEEKVITGRACFVFRRSCILEFTEEVGVAVD